MTAARIAPCAGAPTPSSRSLLLPVLPLDDVCLFPGASLTLVLDRPASVTAVELATRTGDRLLALARREHDGAPRELHAVGTLAEVRADQALSPLEQRVELDGLSRARVVAAASGATCWSPRSIPLEEGDAGDEWGAAVEALARYLHAHADLRSFLDAQRRSTEPWPGSTSPASTCRSPPRPARSSSSRTPPTLPEDQPGAGCAAKERAS